MTDRAFRLVDYLPEVSLIFDAVAGWEADDTRYVPITLAGPDGLVFTSQLDIAGWTKEGLTAFFASMATQRSEPYTSFMAPVPTDTLSVRDTLIVSDVPIDLTNVVNQSGFIGTTMDFTSIKYASCQIYTETTTSHQMIQADSFQFGSGEPTASGTLYFARILQPVMVAPAPAKSVSVPQLRWIAEGVASEEAEYVYLQRLRRSYELQQSP